MNKSVLPRGWAIAGLQDLVGVDGFVADGDWIESKDQDPDGEIRLTQLADIGDGEFRDRSSRFLTRAKAEDLGCTHLQAGDLLIARMPDPLGRCCLLPALSRECVTAVDVCIVRLGSSEVSNRWLMHTTNSAAVRNTVASLQSGSTRKRISKKNLLTLRFPVPPVPEQARIADAIETQLTRLDAAITALERVQANLKRYRASVLKAAVEGRLVPTEAELARRESRDYEPASVLLLRILAERRRRWEESELAAMQAKGKTSRGDGWKQRYEEPMLPDPDVLAELPALPDGWRYVSMDQITCAMTSGSRDWSPYYGQGSSTFIMAQNVRPLRLDLSYRQLVDPPQADPGRRRCQVQREDLLVTIVGANTGDVCRVPNELPEHFVCQSVALMRPVDETLGRYIELYLNSPIGRMIYERYMYGEGRPHLKFDQLRATPMLLPPSAEAQRIADECERGMSLADELLHDEGHSVRRCERLRQALLKWAFEGKLVDQDPADEPASVLLERIRAERAAERPAARVRRPAKRTRRVA